MNIEVEVSEKEAQEVINLCEELRKVLYNSKLDVNKCGFCLTQTLIMSTRKMKVSKPNLLSMISESWESIDKLFMENEMDSPEER